MKRLINQQEHKGEKTEQEFTEMAEEFAAKVHKHPKKNTPEIAHIYIVGGKWSLIPEAPNVNIPEGAEFVKTINCAECAEKHDHEPKN